MTARRLTTRLEQVGFNIESAWNRIVVRVRTRHMPKSIKRVKHSLQGKRQPGLSGDDVQFDYGAHDSVMDGMTFYPRYMGSTLVEELVDSEPGANYFNTGLSTKALDRIISVCRNKNLLKVSVNVSPKGMQIMESRTRNILVDVGMDRVSFCTNDKKYGKVTAVIIRNYVNETMECHAFLCDKTKMAQSMAKVISQAFTSSKQTAIAETANASKEYPSTDEDDAAHDDHVKIQSPKKDESLLINTVTLDSPVYTGYPSDPQTKTVNQVETTHSLFVIDDEFTTPQMRARSDSDTFAMFAAGASENQDDRLENEFSSFARSRSQTNLRDLHTSVHSGWNI